MKLSIVLPVFNEEENVALIPEILVPELKNLGCDYEILLIDDGSTDGSVEVARALAIPEIKIVRHDRNRGIGAAVKTAIREASGELMVILDSDFTFHPRYIKDLVNRFKNGDIDFVIGSPRLASFGADIQKYRVFISVLANMVYSALLGKKITAVSPIFRLYKTSQLKELKIETDGFDISVEILFRLILAGRQFAEVPTPLGARQFGVSKLNYKKEIIRHLFLLRKIMVWRFKNFAGRFFSFKSRYLTNHNFPFDASSLAVAKGENSGAFRPLVQVGGEHYKNLSYDNKARWLSYWYQIRAVLEAEPKTVLEVGMGNGLVSSYLKERGIAVTTLDIDENLKPDVRGSVISIPLPDFFADCILAAEILEHLPFNDLPVALSELRRVSKRAVIVSVPDSRRTLFNLALKLPLLPRLDIFWKVQSLKEHKFDGQHYWEMGKRGYSCATIEKIILDSGFKIKKHFVPFDCPTKHFFVLEKS